MKNIKVSIVCITYNQQEFITKALDGFLMQKTDFQFEIIIADDNSHDNTSKIIMEYARNHPESIRPILRKRNIGPQSNFIDALKSARGEYIALCEGDDFWTDSLKLQKQADFLDSHESFGLVFHPVRVIFENREEAETIFPEISSQENFNVENLLMENFIQTNSVMYRRISYSNLSPDVMPFDWYLHLLHAQNGAIGFINEVMSVYRRHEGGLWWQMYKDPMSAWKKYGESYLLLCHELMHYFGGSVGRKKIILKHIARVYEAFYEGSLKDESYTTLATNSIRSLPTESWEYLKSLIVSNKELKDAKEKTSERLTRKIENLNAALHNTIAYTQSLEDEIKSIKSSKVWRYTTKIKKLTIAVKSFLFFK